MKASRFRSVILSLSFALLFVNLCAAGDKCIPLHQPNEDTWKNDCSGHPPNVCGDAAHPHPCLIDISADPVSGAPTAVQHGTTPRAEIICVEQKENITWNEVFPAAIGSAKFTVTFNSSTTPFFPTATFHGSTAHPSAGGTILELDPVRHLPKECNTYSITHCVKKPHEDHFTCKTWDPKVIVNGGSNPLK